MRSIVETEITNANQSTGMQLHKLKEFKAISLEPLCAYFQSKKCY